MDFLHAVYSFIFNSHVGCTLANPLLGGIIGLGGGLLKHFISDAPREAAQRRVQAETTRWSPWTGMSAAAPQSADAFGSGLQFGTTGAMLGQGMENQTNQNDFNSKYLDILGGQGGQGGQGGGQPLSQQVSQYQLPNLKPQSSFGGWGMR